MNRFCKICCIEKPLTTDYFKLKNKYKQSKIVASYFCHKCLDCDKIYRTEYRVKNINKIKKCQKEWRQNNKNYKRKYYEKHTDYIKAQNKEYNQTEKAIIRKREYSKEYNKRDYVKNKAKIRKKQYYIDNRDEILKLAKEYRSNPGYKEKRNKRYREKTHKKTPIASLRHAISKRVSEVLNKNGGSKQNSSILKYLPYTIEELKIHLESQFESWMNWSNYGKANVKLKTWQLDHIIPQSDLPYSSMEHYNFKKCWDLSNLRPYCSIKNSSDGASRIRHVQ